MARKQKSSYPTSMEPYQGFMKQCMFNRYLIFYLVSVMHFTWGAYVLYLNKHFNISPLKHVFDDIDSTHFVAWMFIGAALLAACSIHKNFKNLFIKILFLLPQQMLLIWTALSVLVEHKAIERLPLLLIAIFHTAALLYNFVFVPVVICNDKK